MKALRLTYLFCAVKLALIGVLFSIALSVSAQSKPTPQTQGRYASIIVDMDNEEIIHARQIDAARYPASLTKVMTLYLTFDALNEGRLKIDQPLPISRYAASQPPSKLGLKAGQTILVRDAINALIIRSANDAALVLAEAISGSEDNFAHLMTQRAKQLGMTRTRFQNPHGLPDPAHISTARDMAKLAAALIRDHRTYYPLFGQRSFKYRGQTIQTTNSLLGATNGVDGLKTGYTYASGYNLTISAERNGRRLVAVVLGGASGNSRDQHMRDLIERGFEVIMSKPAPAPRRVAIKREPVTPRKPVQQASTSILKLRDSSGQTQTVIQGPSKVTRPKASIWSLYLTDFAAPHEAEAYLNTLTANNIQLRAHGQILQHNRRFKTRFNGLSHKDANALCQHIKAQKHTCLMVQQAVGVD